MPKQKCRRKARRGDKGLLTSPASSEMEGPFPEKDGLQAAIGHV